MTYPAAYRYTKDHEWIDAASGTVGITDYAQ
jgi:glycine cleavage system H protein